MTALVEAALDPPGGFNDIVTSPTDDTDLMIEGRDDIFEAIV